MSRLYNIIATIITMLGDAINRLGEDYIVEQGTTSGWTWRKWNSGIYEAERAWNIGKVTIGNSISTGVKGTDAINVLQPPHELISGDVSVAYLGSTSSSGIWVEKTSYQKLRFCKAADSSVVLQNVTVALRVVAGRWK